MQPKVVSRERLEPVNVRVPVRLREIAKQMANEQTGTYARVTESDVYRAAIDRFIA